jgi:hypothetical protein
MVDSIITGGGRKIYGKEQLDKKMGRIKVLRTCNNTTEKYRVYYKKVMWQREKEKERGIEGEREG